MGVSLVYLGRNDDDKEMHRMCAAIADKLIRSRVQVQQTNPGSKDLPEANTVEYDEVWFCGHSRFVEANASIRKVSGRTLGGFPIKDIAQFVKSWVARGRNRIRLICCESAQEQRYKPPQVGEPPEGLSNVLGNVYLVDATYTVLDDFRTRIDAKVSHLEELILVMAQLWRAEKNANQPGFDICGLWGAGDITGDDVPISSFLQDMGSLEAQAKMNDSTVKGLQRETYQKTFENAHCTNKGLPDFFGYSIGDNFLVDWSRRQRTICLVLFKCNKKNTKADPICIKLPDRALTIPEAFWANFKAYAHKPDCLAHNNTVCMQDKAVFKTTIDDGWVKLTHEGESLKLEVTQTYDGNGEIETI